MIDPNNKPQNEKDIEIDMQREREESEPYNIRPQ
jgi:hypothetical protein